MAQSRETGMALFDLDGLLLDTERVYTEVTRLIVGRFGKTFDWSVKANMIGRPARDSAAYLVKALDLPISADQYLDEREAMLRVRFADTEPLPGARELVEHLAAHGVPMALATSSHRDLFEIKARHHQDWFRLFREVITGDDPEIGRGKPAPDIFLLAARRLGGVPGSAVVFEDAPSGLAAAKAAGMRCVVVPDPNMDRSRYQDADLVLESLEDFDPVAFGLPAFP